MTATRRIVLAVVLVALVVTGCATDTDPVSIGAIENVPAFATSSIEEPLVPRPTSELAGLTRPAGSALTLPETQVGPRPVSMSFEAIGTVMAPVIPVGVEPNGDMEIPGAAEVGWYEHGPIPGAGGSSVLAAHVAWNGDDGVFRRLARAEPGQRFTVGFDDGSIAEYEIVAVRQYAKDELPTAQLFATDGDPQVVLITCGGSFNRSLNSYDDNIVAYAVPV